MARRGARSAPPNTADDPRLSDRSPELWNDELSDVAKALLTSAVRCFALNGYHATTTREISTGVGRSPATLYVHFRSKEHALFEIVRSAHEGVLAYIGDPAADAADALERLRLMVSRYTAWHARHHVAARVAQHNLAALTPQHYREILALRRQTNDLFRDAIGRGIAEGSFLAVDVHRIVRAMLSLSIDLVRWYRLDGPDSPEQLGDFYADLALTMVVNRSEDRAVAQGSSREGVSAARQRAARVRQ